ncbi:hypothetical protein BDR06DRAFT_968455 [Suillus hirtellus]|nr:hypothetical protein BDR06DRAFT_968455 [Suillus hirtellus]
MPSTDISNQALNDAAAGVQQILSQAIEWRNGLTSHLRMAMEMVKILESSPILCNAITVIPSSNTTSWAIHSKYTGRTSGGATTKIEAKAQLEENPDGVTTNPIPPDICKGKGKQTVLLDAGDENLPVEVVKPNTNVIRQRPMPKRRQVLATSRYGSKPDTNATGKLSKGKQHKIIGGHGDNAVVKDLQAMTLQVSKDSVSLSKPHEDFYSTMDNLCNQNATATESLEALNVHMAAQDAEMRNMETLYTDVTVLQKQVRALHAKSQTHENQLCAADVKLAFQGNTTALL